MTKTVVLVGALDTKGAEFAFVKDLIERAGLHTLVVDFGVMGAASLRAGYHPGRSGRGRRRRPGLSGPRPAQGRGHARHGRGPGGRGRRRLYDEGRLDGILGMGGSGNTSIATRAMRTLPVGVPKVMVSHAGRRRCQRLHRHQGHHLHALHRRRGRHQQHQPRDLQQRGRGHRRHGADGGAAGRERKAADHRLHVRQHHDLCRPGARASWRTPATRCWSSTPPAPAAGPWRA